MEPKDLVTVGISSLALISSVVAFIISSMRGRRESHRALREQFTSTLNKITDNTIEYCKIIYTEEAQSTPGYRQRIEDLFGQRNHMLLQEAIYLTRILPAYLFNPVDYNTIAVASASAGEQIQA